MDKKSILKIGGIASVTLVLGFGFGRFFMPSHSGHDHGNVKTETQDSETDEKPTTWTCSMHPQIQQPESGDCPICGMDLIPLINDSGADDGPRNLSMSESSRALADIQTTEVFREFPELELRIVGKLAYDQTKEKSLTARFPARIDDLYVNFTGVKVKSGEHLAKVYSPDLLTAQRELLSAYRSDPNSSITNAAREKLRLWDLLPDQIDAIIKNDEAKDHFVLRAPIGGVVVSKHVKEGDYIKTGQSLFRIVDLSELWLYLDAYESDLVWLRYGQKVNFTVQAFPGESFEGQIAFIDPEVNQKTRTIAVRVNVRNIDDRLKPGMFSRGVIAVKMAEGGKVYAPEFAGKWISPMHPEVIKDGPGSCDVCGMDLVPAEDLGYVANTEDKAPLIIPASSVLRTGKRAVVYVEKPNAERPSFEGREITIGPRAGDKYIVIEGLMEGERVVSNGAFKIDSSLQIKAKPSMMNPQGGGPTPGHNHGASKMNSHESMEQNTKVNIDISPDLAALILPEYANLQSALAGDDLEKAKSSLKAMMSITGHSGDLANMLHTMLSVESLDGLRKPHFEMLSNGLIQAAKSNPDLIEGSVIIMHCPMALDGAGADWIQTEEPLQNPYFGAMMLKCGEIKETISSTKKEQNSHAH